MIRPTLPRVHIRRLEEVFRCGNPGYWVHPEWEIRFPWLAQGITGRDSEGGGGLLNFALFTDSPAPGGREAWEALCHRLGFHRIVHSRQVHGKKVLVHRGEGLRPEEPRLSLSPDADGHVTGGKGLLLGVTVADCVPLYLVEPESRVVGLIHAGWRSTVAGILEEGVSLLTDLLGASAGNLHLHLGPAICGECYEVGPEVHGALGLPDPGGPRPVDLRTHLSARGVSIGIDERRITESAWCTRCEGSPFFSHRRGEAGRQVGFLGIRPPEKK